jgi:HJR/Mrr/RecB family endonuclease
MTEVSKKALKATVALKAITVSKEIKIITNISCYLHARKSVIFITNQIISQ